MTTQYGRGRRFEYRVRTDLERLGYTVFRSAGSKGPADLIALCKGRVPLLVQCKIGGDPGRDEWNGLLRTAENCGAIAVVAVRVGKNSLWRVILRERNKYERVETCGLTCSSVEEVLDCASAKEVWAEAARG